MSQITAEEFKTVRESLNLSTRDVADMFDIRGERTVRAWEAGKAPIPDEVGDRLLEIDAAVEDAVTEAFQFLAPETMTELHRCETPRQVDFYWPYMAGKARTSNPRICNAFVARVRLALIPEGVEVKIVTAGDV